MAVRGVCKVFPSLAGEKGNKQRQEQAWLEGEGGEGVRREEKGKGGEGGERKEGLMAIGGAGPTQSGGSLSRRGKSK
eukprot:scaffold23467_cov11-Tisochrysis_lutea.AAC.1